MSHLVGWKRGQNTISNFITYCTFHSEVPIYHIVSQYRLNWITQFEKIKIKTFHCKIDSMAAWTMHACSTTYVHKQSMAATTNQLGHLCAWRNLSTSCQKAIIAFSINFQLCSFHQAKGIEILDIKTKKSGSSILIYFKTELYFSVVCQDES